MASIYERSDQKGRGVWRVVFRRVGKKTLCVCFATEEEARAFAKENEARYVKDPGTFFRDERKERLEMRRERELDVKDI